MRVGGLTTPEAMTYPSVHVLAFRGSVISFEVGRVEGRCGCRRLSGESLLRW